MAQPVANMEDPAVTRVRQLAPAVDQVLAGAFTEDDRYDVWRPAGTDDWLLLNTVDGAGRIGVAGHPDVITEPGDVVIIRPGGAARLRDGPSPAGGGDHWSLQFAHFRPGRSGWPGWTGRSRCPGWCGCGRQATPDGGSMRRCRPQTPSVAAICARRPGSP